MLTIFPRHWPTAPIRIDDPSPTRRSPFPPPAGFVSAPPCRLPPDWSAALTRMVIQYPRMKLQVVEADLNTLRMRDLRARNIDFAVARLLEPLSGDEFAAELLF
jgi:DNA-binding transcriptional LysR family regulator